MLCVGGWLSEKDWACGVLDVLSSTGNCLSVGLHGELLEVCWEAVEVLIESEFKHVRIILWIQGISTK